MSSNEVETMPRTHTLDSDSLGDVLNHDNSNPDIPNSSPIGLTDHVVEPDVVANGEFTKPVRLSTGKRRKVIPDANFTPLLGRRTRSGGENRPTHASVKRSAPKFDTVEKLRDAATSAPKKKLQEIFEVHDNKVRELFHLTKFVTLVDYDVTVAKEDESEVFQEV